MRLRLAFACAVLTALPAAAIELSAPIVCPTGLVCPVQNLFDHESGAGMRDFRCTALGYDGHDGVDFRVPSTAVQKAGVEVSAAADGVVVAIRDGMDDISQTTTGPNAPEGAECGNGVMIRHDPEWTTQYCHLAKGSVVVRKGEAVERGQPIGRVGLSGLTQFPHLHFALRRKGKPVDPYAIDGPSRSCGQTKSAWAKDAAAAVAVNAPLILNAGLTHRPVPEEDIESGAVEERKPGADPEALIAYGRVIGLARNDSLRVRLLDPDYRELARNDSPMVDGPKAQWSLYVGRKRPVTGWRRGDYRARIELLRSGRVLKTVDVTARIGG